MNRKKTIIIICLVLLVAIGFSFYSDTDFLTGAIKKIAVLKKTPAKTTQKAQPVKVVKREAAPEILDAFPVMQSPQAVGTPAAQAPSVAGDASAGASVSAVAPALSFDQVKALKHYEDSSAENKQIIELLNQILTYVKNPITTQNVTYQTVQQPQPVLVGPVAPVAAVTSAEPAAPAPVTKPAPPPASPESLAPVENGDVVWFGDSVPGTPGGDESWEWKDLGLPPFNGVKVHGGQGYDGRHQHLFTGAAAPFEVKTGDILVAYVFYNSDPVVRPKEIMLQWQVGGDKEHRAYWGENKIDWGVDGTASRYYMGPIPSPSKNQWVRFEVPAWLVDLENKNVDGMAFTLFGGTYVYFTHEGKAQGKLLTDGLAGLWTFDEGAGATALDTSGNNNNGTVEGEAAWVDGRVSVDGIVSKALSFDGVDDRVTIPDADSLDISKEITISFWFNPSEVSKCSNLLVQKASKFGDSNYSLYYFGEGNPANSKSVVLHFMPTKEWWRWVHYNIRPTTIGIWQHVAMTFKSGGDGIGYLNGVQIKPLSLPNIGDMTTNNQPVYLGYGQSSFTGECGQYFNGSMDDVRIYNRALSPYEVLRLAQMK